MAIAVVLFPRNKLLKNFPWAGWVLFIAPFLNMSFNSKSTRAICLLFFLVKFGIFCWKGVLMNSILLPFTTDRISWFKVNFCQFTKGLIQQVERLLLLKTSFLLMDECWPALHLELLEICPETVEMVMFLPKSPATTLKIHVFPAPVPILLSMIFSITRSKLLLPSALTLLLLKWRTRSKGLPTVVKLKKNFFGAFLSFNLLC